VGAVTRQRLLEHFGSVRALKQTAEKNPDALTAVVNKATAEKIRAFFAAQNGTDSQDDLVRITVG
jgi:excinuclease ABC subunit C